MQQATHLGPPGTSALRRLRAALAVLLAGGLAVTLSAVVPSLPILLILVLVVPLAVTLTAHAVSRHG